MAANLHDTPDLVAPRAQLSYYDRQSVTMSSALSPWQAWSAIMSRPLPGLRWAFAVRDAISARFGVARIGGFSGRKISVPQVGDHLDFFLVERSDPSALTLTARDRHLDVMIAVTTSGCEVALTASVIPHNWFGRIYMWPVGPAHRLIVWAMLRRLRKDVPDQAEAAL